MGNKKKIKAFILAVFMVIAIFNVHEVDTEAASNNTTWALYYVQGGTSKTVGVYSIYTYGNGYKATCSDINTNATAQKVTFSASTNSSFTGVGHVELNRNVVFSNSNTSLVFYPVVAPNVSVIYFKGTMTYNNATRVSMSGTIGINN